MATASIANASFVESATYFDIDTLGGKKLRLNKSGNQLIMGTAAPVLVGSVTEDGTSNPLQVNGNQSITGGDLVFRTAGKGIDFSATSNSGGTMTSELLNDYEEGTWTPTVAFVGTPGTVNYISRDGRYTKIGRIVHSEYIIVGCSITGSVGYVTITGLPFTINATAAGYQSFAPYGNVNFPSSSIVYQQGGTGDTKIYPQILNNSGFYSDMTNSNINSGGVFTVVASYTYSV
jgi:hypothetical protein